MTIAEQKMALLKELREKTYDSFALEVLDLVHNIITIVQEWKSRQEYWTTNFYPKSSELGLEEQEDNEQKRSFINFPWEEVNMNAKPESNKNSEYYLRFGPGRFVLWLGPHRQGYLDVKMYDGKTQRIQIPWCILDLLKPRSGELEKIWDMVKLIDEIRVHQQNYAWAKGFFEEIGEPFNMHIWPNFWPS